MDDPETVAAQLAARVEAELDPIVDRMVQRVRAEVPEFADPEHPELWGALRRSAIADARAGLAAYGNRDQLPASAPLEVAALARAAAQTRIPLTALLRAYRVAQADYWEQLFDLARAFDADADVKLAVVRDITTFILAFVDHLATLATEEFTRERERVLRRHELRRLARVRDMLGGATADLSTEGFDVNAAHLALVVAAPDALAAARAIAGNHPGRLLTVAPEGGVTWAWLQAAPDDLASIHAALADGDPPPGATIGAGRPNAGAAGFRASHREAQTALDLGRTLDRSLTRYHDIALEALTGRDEAAARDYISAELGPLADNTARAARQRETLLHYLTRGQNGAATAAALHISPRTLSYRLRRIEEILGTTIAARSVELHTALRLHQLRG